MTMKNTTRLGLLGLVAGLAFAPGCVVTEPAGVNPFTAKTFSGFASQPGATVELYAFNHSTNAWEASPDVSTTASTTATTYGGRTVYAWHVQTTLLEDPTDWCRVRASCTPGEGDLRIQFREIGGEYNPLLTFDDGGVSCMINAVNNGGDLFASAWNCKAEVFDELRFVIVD